MKIPRVKTKDLLTVTDLSRDEVFDLFKLSAKLKKDMKRGKYRQCLKNSSLAMIFDKRSTRTRVSFETGICQLGGNALFLNSDDIQIGRGETFEDTACVLSRYVNGIMIRTFAHENVERLAEHATIPVINGLTDSFHPCQALADFFSIYEREKDLSEVKMTYIGDGNNVAASLLLGASLIGMHFSLVCPKKYMPDISIIEKAYSLSSQSGARLEITSNIDEGLEGTDYLYTDVWTSMGQEKESAKRKKAFTRYRVTAKLMEKCSDSCKVMHCLPAHRGEEIDADVMDSDCSIIFDQAENRLHVQKAIMCILMQKK